MNKLSNHLPLLPPPFPAVLVALVVLVPPPVLLLVLHMRVPLAGWHTVLGCMVLVGIAGCCIVVDYYTIVLVDYYSIVPGCCCSFVPGCCSIVLGCRTEVRWTPIHSVQIKKRDHKATDLVFHV